MANLVIKFADLAAEPIGTGRDVTAEVLVSYTREVPLTDGTVLQAVPMRKQLGPGGTAIFEVTPADDPTVQADFRGFGLRVEWLLTHRAGRGRQTETRAARTVKVLTSDGATVQFGTLLPAEDVGPQYATVGELLADVADVYATIDNLAATATTLPPGSPATVTVTGAIPNKVVNFSIPRGADGAPGMGYEEGQQLLAQNQATLDAAQSAATDAANAIRDNLATDINTPGTPAYEAISDVAGSIAEPAINTVVGRLLVDATAHGVVGDGTTNNSAALNALIQSVSTAGGGVIVLPIGTYLGIGGITGASNVTLRGVDRDGVIIRKSGSNSTWLNTGASDNFRVENLTIDGAGGVTTRGITFTAGSTDCTLAGVKVLGMPAFAVDTASGASGVNITGSLFVDCNIAVRLSGNISRVLIDGNTFKDWQDSGIYLVGTASTSAQDVTISNNEILPHKTGTPAEKVRQPVRIHGDDTNNHRNVVIRGNTVTGMGTNHADTAAPGSADLISIHRTTGFEVSGNTVRHGGDVGLTIAQGCRDGRVFGNLSQDNDTVGLCLGSAGSPVPVRNVTVTGNTFLNNALDRPDTGGQTIDRSVERAKSSILAVQAQDCVIDGNVIEYPAGHPRATRYAISWRECERVHIGAVGTGNKSVGHTSPYYADTPASTGMTTTGHAELVANPPNSEAGRFVIAGIPIIVGNTVPEGVVTAPRGAVYLRTSGAAGDQIYYKNQDGTNVGWRASSQAPGQNATNLANAAHPINTSGKFKGVCVFNNTTNRPVWASNGDPTSPWFDATGTAVITPT